MRKLIIPSLLMFAAACGSNEPYGGRMANVYIIALDTVTRHYPMTVQLDGTAMGTIRSMSSRRPENCAEANIYAYTTEPDPRVARAILPYGAYTIQVIPSNTTTILSLTFTIDAEACKVFHVPSFE